MQCANKAIIHERHLLPTTKKMLTSWEGEKILSKLDVI